MNKIYKFKKITERVITESNVKKYPFKKAYLEICKKRRDRDLSRNKKK